MSNGNWYYAKGSQQLGPVPADALRQMISGGEVAAEDLVWTDGMAQWQAARSVPSLWPAGSPAAPAPMPQHHQPPPQYGYAPPNGYAPHAGAPGGPQQLQYGVAASYYGQQDRPRESYGGFWRRVLAYILDGLAVGVPLFVVFAIIDVALGIDPFDDRPTSNVGLALEGVEQLLNILVSWLYFALMESSERQATLGKIALGMRVTDMEGNRIGFARATGRYFAKIVSALLLCVGFIMVAFTGRRQGLHDIMASTLVPKTTVG